MKYRIRQLVTKMVKHLAAARAEEAPQQSDKFVITSRCDVCRCTENARKHFKTSTGRACKIEAFFSLCRPALLLLKIDNLKLKREKESAMQLREVEGLYSKSSQLLLP